MSKLTGVKRIIVEDFKEADRDAAGKIGASFNSFAEEVVKAFDNNITASENLNQFFKDITVTVDASGKPTADTKFKNTLLNTAKGLLVIKCDNTTDTINLNGAPYLSFSESAKIISISNITGLVAGKKYFIRILIIG